MNLTVVLWLGLAVSKWEDGEPWFKQKQGDGVHYPDCVNLISKVSLLMPHQSHKELFVFKNKW